MILKHSKIHVAILHKNNVTFYVSINTKEKNSEQLVSKIKKNYLKISNLKRKFWDCFFIKTIYVGVNP